MIGKVRDMLTFEGLAYACFDYPDMVEDMVETCCRMVEHFLDQVLPHFEFDFASGWEDICFKNGPIVSVPFFRDVVMPRYKRISKTESPASISGIQTATGCSPHPALFAGEALTACFFEVNGCSHPGELLDQYDGQLRIMGG